MVNKATLFIIIPLFLWSCINKEQTIGEKYEDPIVQIEFREFGTNFEVVTELDIFIDKKEVDLYRFGELYYTGILSPGIESQIINSINKIELIHVDRIYNVNSADNDIFEITFWGNRSNYAHMIKLFGSSNAPQSVQEVVSTLRDTARKVGMTKEQ